MNGLLPVPAWPDILVGPALLGGSMVLSFEQLLIDVEVFRMCKRARQGIATDEERWLEEVIRVIGPAGNFLSEESTVQGVRGGEWRVSQLGAHDTFEGWVAAERPRLLEEARQKVAQILATHQPLPQPAEVEHELDRIEKRAREVSGAL